MATFIKAGEIMGPLDRVTTKQAALELNTTVLNIQESLIQKELPIGYAIKRRKSSRYNYVIYRGLLDAYKAQIENGILLNVSGEEEK